MIGQHRKMKSEQPMQKKIRKTYTEVIFEDDYLFHNIKIKGQSVQVPEITNKDLDL